MKFPPKLQSALEGAQSVLRERDQIRALLLAGTQRLQAIEGQLKESLEALATLEAENALSGAPVSTSSSAFKKQRVEYGCSESGSNGNDDGRHGFVWDVHQ